MQATKIDIDAIVIASPCTVPWDSMTGDDAKRFCGQCRLHVHDFSQMTRAEIGDLLRKTDGNVCKRIWRRPDGRMITKDCGRVLEAAKRRVRALASAFAGLLAAIGVGGCHNLDPWHPCCSPNTEPKASEPAAAPATKPPPKPPVPDVYVSHGK